MKVADVALLNKFFFTLLIALCVYVCVCVCEVSFYRLNFSSVHTIHLFHF